MKITKRALALTKKFAAGALCPVNFKRIRRTMFWPHYEHIAKNWRCIKINEGVVKNYWFVHHNEIVLTRLQFGHITPGQAKKCMVRPGRAGKVKMCFHGELPVCPITSEEEKTIIFYTPEDFRASQE